MNSLTTRCIRTSDASLRSRRPGTPPWEPLPSRSSRCRPLRGGPPGFGKRSPGGDAEQVHRRWEPVGPRPRGRLVVDEHDESDGGEGTLVFLDRCADRLVRLGPGHHHQGSPPGSWRWVSPLHRSWHGYCPWCLATPRSNPWPIHRRCCRCLCTWCWRWCWVCTSRRTSMAGTCRPLLCWVGDVMKIPGLEVEFACPVGTGADLACTGHCAALDGRCRSGARARGPFAGVVGGQCRGCGCY